jgi:hypothetical protein
MGSKNVSGGWLSPYEAARKLGLSMSDLQRLIAIGSLSVRETKGDSGKIVRLDVDARSVSKLIRAGLVGKRLRNEVVTQATTAHMQHIVAETQQQVKHVAGQAMMRTIYAAAAVLMLAGVAYWVWG